MDKIVAIIGSEIILKSEVDRFAQQQAFRMRMDPLRQRSKYQELWEQMLQSMIDQKILLDRAELDSIEATDREVDDALEQQVEDIILQAGSKDKAEEMLGYSLSKLRRNLRDEIKKRILVDRIKAEKFRDVSVNRREVEEFYSEYADSLPEMKPSVNLSHILLEVRASVEADSMAWALADSLRKKAIEGENFADLARRYSEDPNSAANGGELGFIQRGSLVLEYEEAAYALEPRQISDVVKSEFGYHVIQLLERRGEKVNTRHILIMPKFSVDDEKRVIRILDTLKHRIESGEDMKKLALEYSDDPEVKLNKGDLGWFEIESMSIKEFKAVIDTLPVGSVSKPFRTDFGYHIVRNNGFREGGKLTLEKNWTDIENFVINRKRLEIYKEWLRSIRSDVYIEVKK